MSVCKSSAKHHKLRASRSIGSLMNLDYEKPKLSIFCFGNYLLFYVFCQIPNALGDII